MNDLQTALINKFKETSGGLHNSLYSLIGGQMYKELAGQKKTLPYIVFHLISDTPDWNFTSFFERVRIQFDLYSSTHDSSQVEYMYRYLRDLFDWCTLDIAGNDHVYMRRELAKLSKDPVEDVWTYTVDYEIMMEQIVENSPSVSPSSSPSASPSRSPSKSPSASPSKSPSGSPSLSPSASASPSASPSISPSASSSPSVSPSGSPS